MTEPSNPAQDQFAPCGILCDACPLGSGAVAESVANHDLVFDLAEVGTHIFASRI